MNAVEFYGSIVVPSASILPKVDVPAARCMLLAIAGVESSWTYRIQRPIDYAHGFWQFEKRGACAALFENEDTQAIAESLCLQSAVDASAEGVFDAIVDNDRLAYGMARLLLWSDPAPLPAIGAEVAAWNYYVRNWRPGKPGRERWRQCYHSAVSVIKPS